MQKRATGRARKRSAREIVPANDISGIRLPERAQVAPAEPPPPGVEAPSAWGPVVVLLVLLAFVIWAGYFFVAARG